MGPSIKYVRMVGGRGGFSCAYAMRTRGERGFKAMRMKSMYASKKSYFEEFPQPHRSQCAEFSLSNSIPVRRIFSFELDY